MDGSGADLINLSRYPINVDGPERDAVLAYVRKALDADGCAVLKGFLTQDGVDALTKEADSLAGKGHQSFNLL